MKRLTRDALAALSILAFTTVCFAQEATSTREPITDKSDPRAVLFAEDNNLDARLPEESTPSATPKMPLSTSTNKPNIIFILTDDQPPNTIGLAGNAVIRTPNINSLGQQGVYFNNMYLPIGQCAPSRASILTGKLPHTHGVIGNQVILPPAQLTLSEILQANGYATAIIGKCHLGVPTNPEKYKRGRAVINTEQEYGGRPRLGGGHGDFAVSGECWRDGHYAVQQ
jgi:arylsulfatase A-like enzyme